MKSNQFLISLIALLLLIVGCKQQEFNSRWTTKDHTIDGADSEWDTRSIYHLKDYGILLGLRNAQDHLYLLINTTNPNLAHKMRTQGLTIWLDPTISKKKTQGLYYRGALRGRANRNPEDSFQSVLTEAQRAQYRAKLAELSDAIAVFDRNKMTRILPDTTNGRVVSRAFDAKGCQYEYKIPLGPNDRLPIEFDVEPGAQLGICIELGLPGDAKERRNRIEPWNELPMRENFAFDGPAMDRSSRSRRKPKYKTFRWEQAWITVTLAAQQINIQRIKSCEPNLEFYCSRHFLYLHNLSSPPSQQLPDIQSSIPRQQTLSSKSNQNGRW